MKLAAVLLLVALAGCHSKRAKYAGAAATFAGGIVAIAAAPPKERCVYSEELFDLTGELCEVGQDLRASMLVLGIAMIATAVVYAAVISTPPAQRDETSLDQKIVERLGAQTAVAARAGDCAAVRMLLAKIARRDHWVEVASEPAIARCLE